MAGNEPGSQAVHPARSDVSRDIQALLGFAESGSPGTHPYVVLLGLRSYDTPSLLKRLVEGLSFAAFRRLQRNMDLSQQELAELVDMSTRTLARRREKGRLESDESDRLVRLARVFALTIELFEGDVEAARSWLQRPQIALGGATPFQMLKTGVGTREVEALIGRLEHGVYS